jgi:hypothetical protein
MINVKSGATPAFNLVLYITLKTHLMIHNILVYILGQGEEETSLKHV